MCIHRVCAGVLWLSVISEFTYIGLLGMGFLLMWLEVLCSHKEMHSLKISAYAAICTVLSGETRRVRQIHIIFSPSFTSLRLISTFVQCVFCLFPHLCRSSWDGCPHDVHHCIPDDRHRGPQRLEASVLGLWMVICVGFFRPSKTTSTLYLSFIILIIFNLVCYSASSLAWVSFSCCMGAAVVTLNSYTKTIIELRRRQRLRLEEARATTHAPSYDEVVPGGGFYSVSGLLQCPDGMIDVAWAPNGSVVGVANGDVSTLVLVGGCGPEGCEDCEREMDEMEGANDRVDSPC